MLLAFTPSIAADFWRNPVAWVNHIDAIPNVPAAVR